MSPIENRFYKQVALTALKEAEMLNLREDQKKTLQKA